MRPRSSIEFSPTFLAPRFSSTTAPHGAHNEHFQTRHGVITISRLHNSRGERVVERPYGEVTFTEKDGSDLTRNLHLRNGRPHLVELDEVGDMVLVPLMRKKVHAGRGCNGSAGT